MPGKVEEGGRKGADYAGPVSLSWLWTSPARTVQVMKSYGY